MVFIKKQSNFEFSPETRRKIRGIQSLYYPDDPKVQPDELDTMKKAVEFAIENTHTQLLLKKYTCLKNHNA